MELDTSLHLRYGVRMDQRTSADVSWLLEFVEGPLREALESCGISHGHQGTVISRVHLELEYALIGEPRIESDELESVKRVPSPIEAA